MVRRKSRSKPNLAINNSHTHVNITKKSNRKNYVLKEIKNLQRSTRLLIQKAPFARLVREIIDDIFPERNSTRIQVSALEALQEAVEMYLVQFFEDALHICLHTNRVTLMQKDMILLRRLRGRNDVINK